VHLLEISLPTSFSLRRNPIGENREKEKEQNGNVKYRRKKKEGQEK
jgi:hypothetical protein